MNNNGFVSAIADTRARDDILEQGFTRRPLRVDVDIARALGVLAHAAWSMPRDQYYEGGTRFRTLNRFKAQIAAGGVHIWPCDDTKPYVQLEKYNTTLGGKQREYAPLPLQIGDRQDVLGQPARAEVRGDSFSAVRHEPSGLTQGW